MRSYLSNYNGHITIEFQLFFNYGRSLRTYILSIYVQNQIETNIRVTVDF